MKPDYLRNSDTQRSKKNTFDDATDRDTSDLFIILPEKKVSWRICETKKCRKRQKIRQNLL
jgi:hypothetical protein